MGYIAELKLQKNLIDSHYQRSLEWRKVRKRFLILHPICVACGGRDRVQAHHIRPFYLWPELELEESNLITLCEAGTNHHLFLGHYDNYTSYNLNVETDAVIWADRLKDRPKYGQRIE